jgi:hypothetical protein
MVAAQGPAASVRHRVLFIGNSLTSVNNVPAMVAAIARAANVEVETYTVAYNNFGLEEHWSEGTAVKAIKLGGWTTVILQQGPSAAPESQVILRDFAGRFAREIKRTGAVPALYMVWPARRRSQDFAGVSESYRRAAHDVKGILLEAGDAWRDASLRRAALQLYGDDGFHPSPAGSYLAALVIARKLFAIPGPPPLPLVSPDASFPSVALSPEDAQVIHEAVDRVVNATVRR